MRPIDDEQIEIIRRLYPEGNLKDVAERAECSGATVIKYAKSMGLRKTRTPNTEIAERKRDRLARFRRLVEKGISYAKAAKSMGYCREMGIKWARELGLSLQCRHRITEEEGREILRLAKSMPYSVIAEKIGCSHTAVSEYVLRVSPETAREHGEEFSRRSRERMLSWTSEQKDKASRRRKEAYDKDRRRWLNGLPQKTGWKFGRQTGREREQRRRLRKRGYEEDADDRSLFYITPGTRRSVVMERNSTEKYKIRFEYARETEFGHACCRAGAGQQDTEKIGDDGH